MDVEGQEGSLKPKMTSRGKLNVNSVVAPFEPLADLSETGAHRVRCERKALGPVYVVIPYFRFETDCRWIRRCDFYLIHSCGFVTGYPEGPWANVQFRQATSSSFAGAWTTTATARSTLRRGIEPRETLLTEAQDETRGSRRELGDKTSS